MWFVDNFLDGMPPIPGAALDIFRVVVGLAFLWKVCWEHRWGVQHYMDPGSLVRWRHLQGTARVKVVPSPAAYRVLYGMRAVAAVALLLGVLPRAAAAALAAWSFFEYSFDRKSSHAFLGLGSAALALSDSAGGYLSLGSWLDAGSPAAFLAPDPRPDADPWPQLLLILAVVHLYWSSAWHKLRSAQFMSGDALQKVFEQLAMIRYELPARHREYWFPERFDRRFALGDPDEVRRRWRGPAIATVALEALLPVLLLIPLTWPVAVAAGVAMHAGFTTMMPKRLLPFTLAAIGSYPLFLDPAVLSRWLAR